MKAFVIWLLVVLFMVAVDIKRQKRPIDGDDDRDFDFKKDWMVPRWDDAAVWAIGGAIGALLAHELAVPIILKYVDWPELAESSIDLTSVALCTLLGAKLLERLFISKL